MFMAICWDAAVCSLLDIIGRFTAAYYLHHQSDEARL
jgi:hypothetical protein